jgi:hypothetical protein
LRALEPQIALTCVAGKFLSCPEAVFEAGLYRLSIDSTVYVEHGEINASASFF